MASVKTNSTTGLAVAAATNEPTGSRRLWLAAVCVRAAQRRTAFVASFRHHGQGRALLSIEQKSDTFFVGNNRLLYDAFPCGGSTTHVRVLDDSQCGRHSRSHGGKVGRHG